MKTWFEKISVGAIFTDKSENEEKIIDNALDSVTR